MVSLRGESQKARILRHRRNSQRYYQLPTSHSLASHVVSYDSENAQRAAAAAAAAGAGAARLTL